VYSLEYIEIPKVFFFMPHHRWWCEKAASLLMAQRNCGLTSLLLKRNICNNGIQGKCCDVIWGHCCELTMTAFPTVAKMCSNNDLSSHCWNNVFQQWPWVMQVTYFQGKIWQTDRHGPIMRSSFMLEHEEYLKKTGTYWTTDQAASLILHFMMHLTNNRRFLRCYVRFSVVIWCCSDRVRWHLIINWNTCTRKLI
jgi:hypothetical protein